MTVVEKKERDVFVAIQVAVARGVGLRLTFEEVVTLAGMSAMEDIAYDSLMERGVDITEMTLDEIAKVKP